MKHFAEPKPETEAARRYSPTQCVGAERRAIVGNPNMRQVSTSHVERSNLSIRMGLRRFTRLTNAFSKKAQNHVHGLSIYFMHYNFCRIHQTLRVTPAMAAGVTPKLWELSDMVGVLEDWEAEQAKAAIRAGVANQSRGEDEIPN